MHAVEDLHQRRLAGAVLAEQRVDFACAHLDVDAAQGLHAAEVLGDAAAEDSGSGGVTRRSSRKVRAQGADPAAGYWPAPSRIL